MGMTYRRSSTTVASIVAAVTASVLALAPPALAADRTAPTTPQGLQVTGTTDSSVSLAWSPSTDASGRVTYRVYVDGAQQGDAAEPAHTRGGLASDTSYTFVVRAVDRYGNVSRASSPVTGSTAKGGGGGGAGDTPLNLHVTGVQYDSINLAWDAPAGVPIAYYLIYRNGLWVNSSYGTTGIAQYLGAGTTHNIEVRARHLDNSLSAPAAVTATTLADAGPPTTPSNLRVASDSFGRPSGLVWDASTDDRGVSDYWLLADGNDAFGGGLGVSFYSLTDEYCTVFRGQTYTFTVRARDLSGNVSAVGTPLTITIP
jgi:predicted phage tail protein